MLHIKELCIWCIRPDERGKKKKGREKENKFHRIEQRKSWRRFCSGIPYLEDDSMRDRILTFIDTVDDPFGEDIFYHKKCWDKYIYSLDKSGHHLQNVSSTKMKAMFIQHIQNTVFISMN